MAKKIRAWYALLLAFLGLLPAHRVEHPEGPMMARVGSDHDDDRESEGDAVAAVTQQGREITPPAGWVPRQIVTMPQFDMDAETHRIVQINVSMMSRRLAPILAQEAAQHVPPTRSPHPTHS